MNALGSDVQNANVPFTMHGRDDSGSISTSAIENRLQNVQYHIFATEDRIAAFASDVKFKNVCAKTRQTFAAEESSSGEQLAHTSLLIFGAGGCMEACSQFSVLTALQLPQQAMRSPWKRLDVRLAHQHACLLSRLCHFCCGSEIHLGLHH